MLAQGKCLTVITAAAPRCNGGRMGMGVSAGICCSPDRIAQKKFRADQTDCNHFRSEKMGLWFCDGNYDLDEDATAQEEDADHRR